MRYLCVCGLTRYAEINRLRKFAIVFGYISLVECFLVILFTLLTPATMKWPAGAVLQLVARTHTHTQTYQAHPHVCTQTHRLPSLVADARACLGVIVIILAAGQILLALGVVVITSLSAWS